MAKISDVQFSYVLPREGECAVLPEGTVIDPIARVREGVEALKALHNLLMADIISHQEHQALRSDVIKSMRWRGE